MWNGVHKSIFFNLYVIFAVHQVNSQGGVDGQNVLHTTEEQTQTPSFFFYHRAEYPRDCQEVARQCSSSNSGGVHLIKPDGYTEPFEVYCDNILDNGGWTVIQRRHDASISFNRSWKDYDIGFGFPSQEFWIGNERLSYLTNQKRYHLRIEMTSIDNSSFYVTYDAFRISDSFSDYRLVSAANYNGTSNSYITWCPTNKEYGNCTCEGTCADPDSCTNSCSQSQSCVCPDGFLMSGGDCIPKDECGCYISEAYGGRGMVLSEGDVYISPNCNRRCSCSSGQLVCDNTYQCSTNALCEERNGLLQCYCHTGYAGDGVQCTRTSISDCQALYDTGERSSGVHTLQPPNWSGNPFQVYCNMTDEGGWTVFQRRSDGSVDFNRNWADYTEGFGDPDSELWLGNEKLYHLTNQRNYQLRIDLVSRNGISYYAKYNLFRINDGSDKYRLSAVGTFTGDTGYDYITWHKDKQFSTHDQDNDGSGSYDCAEGHRGGWWFGYYYYYSGSYCRHDDYCDYYPIGSRCVLCYSYSYSYSYSYNCARSFLNGIPDSSSRGTSAFWNYLPGYECGLKYTEMKIRPV